MGALGPRIRKKLHLNKEESWKCSIIWNGAAGYEILYYGDSYVVNLENKSCICGSWELSGIPCCHAICTIYDRQEQPEDYVSFWYSKEMYLRSYSYMMTPIAGENFWPLSHEAPISPPPLKKMPGRPKTLRRKEEHEKESGQRLHRTGREMTCQYCFGKVHNKVKYPVRKEVKQSIP